MERENPAFQAMLRHRGSVQWVTLITSRAGVAMDEWMRAEVQNWDDAPKLMPPVVLDDMSSVDLVKAKVEAAREEAIRVNRIPEGEVLCDFTGMMKPATAGMILACAPRGRRLSYVQGQYDAGGLRILGVAPEFVEIEIEYQVESE